MLRRPAPGPAPRSRRSAAGTLPCAGTCRGARRSRRRPRRPPRPARSRRHRDTGPVPDRRRDGRPAAIGVGSNAMITADAGRRTDHRAAAVPHPQPVRQRRDARLGRGGPQRRPAADLPRGRRPRRAALRQPAGAHVDRRPHRGQRSRRPDAVPDGPHRRRAGEPRRVVARPVRRRADRRRGVGPRRHRHAVHHRRRWPSRSASWPTEGFRPKGTLIYFGVADEEAGGHWGAEYMIDNHWDAVGADYVLTESGGYSTIGHDGTRHITVNVAEKGIAWRRLRVHGTPGHGSMPYGSDNALITAAEIVRRLADVPHAVARRRPVGRPAWRRSTCPTTCAPRCRTRRRCATRSPRCRPTTPASPTPAPTRRCRPTSSTAGRRRTRSPTSSTSTSTCAPSPATPRRSSTATSPRCSASWRRRVEISPIQEFESTRSPVDNPLWDALRTRTQVAYPGANLVPGIITGGTDARFYRSQGRHRLRRRAVLARGHDRVVRPALPRQRRAHRRRRRSACRPSSGTASPARSSAELRAP